jgi:hypothetical protein
LALMLVHPSGNSDEQKWEGIENSRHLPSVGSSRAASGIGTVAGRSNFRSIRDPVSMVCYPGRTRVESLASLALGVCTEALSTRSLGEQ